jgi:hypothetical protein
MTPSCRRSATRSGVRCYLFVSATELRAIAEGAGWIVTDVLEAEGSVYGVRLQPVT